MLEKINLDSKPHLIYILSFIALFMAVSLSGCGSSSNGSEGDLVNNGGGETVLPENSALITWDGPTVNANATNTPLTDLVGYRIYMTTASGVYSAANIVAQISANPTGGGSESHQIDNLVSGTYYFKVTAFDNASPANESASTAEVSKIIP